MYGPIESGDICKGFNQNIYVGALLSWVGALQNDAM